MHSDSKVGALSISFLVLAAGCVGSSRDPAVGGPSEDEPLAGPDGPEGGSGGASQGTPKSAPSGGNGTVADATDGTAPVEETDPGMTFDVADNVPAEELDLIREALVIGIGFLDRTFGGGIPPEVRANITVKIVATGQGNQEEGGGGGCCTALSMSTDPPGGARLFFDVAHPDWVSEDNGNTAWPHESRHLATVVHEYAHAWQWHLGCVSQTHQPLGMWLNEGIAEEIGYSAMIDHGAYDKAEVVAFMKLIAQRTGQWFIPLSLQDDDAPLWAGHIGYLALELAMDGAGQGILPLRTICEDVRNGATREEAFQTAFGTSLDEFYVEFEAWKALNTI